MKRLYYLVTPLAAAAALLLSGCPDAKLPSPAPKVPEPKAQTAMHLKPPAPAGMDLRRNFDPAAATKLS